MKTAQQYLKDEGLIANEHGQFIYKSGNDEVNLKHILDEYAKIYATEKVKEALKVAVSTAQGYVSEADGDLLAHFIGELESELVNNIINEI